MVCLVWFCKFGLVNLIGLVEYSLVEFGLVWFVWFVGYVMVVFDLVWFVLSGVLKFGWVF